MRKTRRINAFISVLIVLACLGGTAAGQTDPRVRPDLDSRLPDDRAARDSWVLRHPTPEQRLSEAALRASVPGVRLRWDGLSGSASWIAAPCGQHLAPPRRAAAETVARAYLREHRALYGLTAADAAELRLSSVVQMPGGGAHVHFTQTVSGIEVFGSHAVVNLATDGSVQSAGARLFGGLAPPQRAALKPEDAARAAVEQTYPGKPFSAARTGDERGPDRRVRFEGDGFGFPPRSRLVVFPEAAGSRPAWEVEVAEPTRFTSYRVLIDAIDGRTLFRENTTFYAEATHIVGSRPVPKTEEYLPVNYLTETIPAATAESPSGWISGAGTTLEGNNASGHVGYWWEPVLADPAADYDHPFNTSESAAVSAWWWSNEAHDRFYALGFDESAGNFQQDNFGLGGIGGDAVKVVQYVAGPRNPQFFTPAVDGDIATVNFGWKNCRFCGDHDGLVGHDTMDGDRSPTYVRGLIFHEYTHGVTTRLAGGSGVTGCSDGTQALALNEGTSDFFGRTYHEPSIRGGYGEGTGVARSPLNDLTYADFCEISNGACGAHNDGMIWSGTLWDLRESFRALDPVGGLDVLHRLVLEGWAGAPCDPTYLDLADAILSADTTLHGSAHHGVLWNVFASRGMGENATTTGNGDTSPVADFTVPAAHVCAAPAMPTGLTAMASGDNAIELSYTATGAAAVEIWREDLGNPHDRAARVGVTDDTTGFIDDSVQGGRSYRYHVVALGSGGIGCRSAASATADATATGACDGFPIFDPGLNVTEDDGSCQVTLAWSAAQPACAGQSIVYNVYRGPTPGFDPSERLLIGRTTSTSFQDVVPLTKEFPFDEQGRSFSGTPNYLVIAQAGTLDDPADHRLPTPPSQLLKWVPAVPTLARTTVAFWDFDSGAAGWTTDNSADPDGEWIRVAPSSTWFAGALLAPDEAAGGSGMAWVTGDGGNSAAHDCDGQNLLISPVWDGTGGATILSFDYWNWIKEWTARIGVRIDNGTDQVRVDVAGLNTTQPFDAAGRHGWQRAELNLADYVAPTSTMSVTFIGSCGSPALVEHGIDNVRVESATACSRSGLRLDAVTVDDAPAGWGNGNGVLEPGETARLQVQITNEGTSTAFGTVGRLSTGAPGVLIHEAADSFPDLPPAASATSVGGGFTVTVADPAACDDSMVFDLEFTDAAGTTSHAVWNPVLSYLVTEIVLQDDFETDLGWGPGGAIGNGRWMRGDPVGTMDGANQANPEDDSPFDAGAQCYVTENGSVGGGPNDADVDGGSRRLQSPIFDLSGYESARIEFDLWHYDNSTGSPNQDFAEQRVFVIAGGTGENHLTSFFDVNPTNGWVQRTIDLTRVLPLISSTRINFFATDSGADHVVETGVDNVVVKGDRAQCDPLGVVNPPNGIDDSLRLGKSGIDAALSWTASAVDGSHDGAAYYRLYVSVAPDGGFAVEDTATETSEARPLDGPSEFYLVVAVNAAGTSGDEPSP